MRKVWYHQIWIQTYLGFIVLILNCTYFGKEALYLKCSLILPDQNIFCKPTSILSWFEFSHYTSTLFQIHCLFKIRLIFLWVILQKTPSYLEVFFVKSCKTNHSLRKVCLKKLQVFLGFIFCKIYFYTKARNFLHFL